MAVHEEVLAMAQHLCAKRRTRRFTPLEVVQALPHLNKGTVRTHVVSRCCVNAPKNHDHRWPYFKRLEPGVYGLCKAYSVPPAPSGEAARPEVTIGLPVRTTIHTVISESEGAFVAECLEVGVVTQGDTLDQVLHNLREAVDLFMEDEDPATLGLVPNPRLAISFETAVR